MLGSAPSSLAVFLVAVFQLDPLVRWLWPIPVVLLRRLPVPEAVHLALPPLARRSLGLAPVGAWVAVTGELPWQAWALGGAVALWVAGFDLFYSLFDVEHDREQGLHSWATRFGERGVFAGRARAATSAPSRCSSSPGSGSTSGVLYWLGVVAVAVLLAYEHSLVRPGDLRRLDAAFFTVNGVISIVFFGFVLADVLAVIRARAVEKRYGRRRALRPLDFELERGGFLVVTGANGSGKTTLLRLVAGLAAPTGGELEVAADRARPRLSRPRAARSTAI